MFVFQTNKEEFDRQARLFLPPHLVHLHNEFLLAVLTKCQSLCQPTTYVYEGIKQRPTVFAPTKKCVKPERISSIEIKPVTIARTIEPKNKPTKVNFEVCLIFVYWLLSFNKYYFVFRIDFNLWTLFLNFPCLHTSPLKNLI